MSDLFGMRDLILVSVYDLPNFFSPLPNIGEHSTNDIHNSSSSNSIFIDEHDNLTTRVLVNKIQVCMYNKVNHREAGSLS